MRGPIERIRDRLGAKRRSGESAIGFDYIPGGFPEHAFLYENAAFGLKIRFPGLYIYKKFPILNDVGQILQQPITVGIILAKGELKREIQRTLGPSAAPHAADDIVSDVYELLLAFFNSDPARDSPHHPRIDVPVHIYELEGRQFWDAVDNGSAGRSYCPEVIEKWAATLVI